jgi:hypothetical protein
MADQPSPRRRYQFRLRTLMIVVTVIGVLLGLSTALVNGIDALILRVERDAARQRVLETGTETEYDRRLLGDEIESLKVQRQRTNPPSRPATQL